MLKHTDEAILAKAKEIWAEEDQNYNSIDFKVEQTEWLLSGNLGKEPVVRLTLSRMYESPGLNLEKLMKLAEFFGTKNINDDDRFADGGCETCDYGSAYGFTLTIREEKK